MNAQSSLNIREVTEDMRMRQELILAEIGEMRHAMGSISHNIKTIADVLDKQADKVIRTLLRAFVAMVSCFILVLIIAVVSITRMDFSSDSHGVYMKPQSQRLP